METNNTDIVIGKDTVRKIELAFQSLEAALKQAKKSLERGQAAEKYLLELIFLKGEQDG